MHRYRIIIASLIIGHTTWLSGAQENPEPAWLAPSVGPFTPSIHLNAAIGDSSGDVEELAVGHHDPTREDGSVQGLELGLSLRQNQLEGFATYVLHYGAEEEWEGEWEEAFLKLRDLPGGFEVRGGRMLGRFGSVNATHLHAWNFVDMPLAVGRLLGEHGLWYEGGDVTWLSQGVANTFGITMGYGEAVAHAHDHGDEHAEEEHEHHDHDEEHAKEEGHEHHDHSLGFGDDVFSARAFAQLRADDYRLHEPGVSIAVGDAADERQIIVYGLDYTYTWREKGLEPGGRAFVWKTELFYRDIDKGFHHEEEEHGHEEEHAGHDHDHEHHTEDEVHGHALSGGGEFGFFSQGVYTLNNRLDVGARFDFVEGNDDLDTQERYRISPMVTTYLDPYRRAALRAQYNYDKLKDDGDEHTFWLQLALNWGGAEVR
jgi:hypothetical protein